MRISDWSSDVCSSDLLDLCRTLNPDNEPGRLTLIHRMGADKICDHLPRLIESVRKAGHQVLWMCDPMHGTTISTPNGLKTRPVDNIMCEVGQAFALNKTVGQQLGGMQLEHDGKTFGQGEGV